MAAMRKGTRAVGGSKTIRDAAEELMEGLRSGAIRTRSGDEYKPSAIRNYEEALRTRVLPRMGHMMLFEVRRGDVQRFVDGLMATGLKPSTIRNTINPLRVIFRSRIRNQRRLSSAGPAVADWLVMLVKQFVLPGKQGVPAWATAEALKTAGPPWKGGPAGSAGTITLTVC
jgi:hypothetical protein